MSTGVRRIGGCVVAVGLLLLASQSAGLAQKGRKISLADDPSLKEGAPAVVLVEVSDYQ
jgi:hypothetical protein